MGNEICPYIYNNLEDANLGRNIQNEKGEGGNTHKIYIDKINLLT